MLCTNVPLAERHLGPTKDWPEGNLPGKCFWRKARRLLRNFDFNALFIEELDWNRKQQLTNCLQCYGGKGIYGYQRYVPYEMIITTL